MARKKDRVVVIVAPAFINGVSIIREMARKGAYVVAADYDPDSVGFTSRFAHEKVLLPPPRENGGALAAWLLSRPDFYGAIVIPTDDFYLKEIAENYDALSPKYRLAVAPPSATLTALDKYLTYQAAEKIGVPIPRTYPVSSLSNALEAADKTGFPAILRPVFSIAFYRTFGRKSFHLERPEDLPGPLEKALAAGHEMVIQEVIPGPDEAVVSCKAYVTGSGIVMAPVPGFKLAIYPPAFGVTQLLEVRSSPPVEEGTRRMLEAVGMRGSLASVEWKYDQRDGLWKLLEINARSVPAISVMKPAGADVLDMLWRDKLGLPQLPPTRVRYGRRWAYLKNGLLLYRGYPGKRLSLWQYMRLYRPPIDIALFDISDMRPFVRDMLPMLARRFFRSGQNDKLK